MKQWTFPQVNVEGFAANEYVAACAQVLPIPGGSKWWYWDWNKNGAYNAAGSTPDESFTAANTNDAHMPTPSLMEELTKYRWYTNQDIYWTSSMMSNGRAYDSSSSYTYYNCDVYVASSSSVYIYPHGEMDTSVKPNGKKNYS